MKAIKNTLQFLFKDLVRNNLVIGVNVFETDIMLKISNVEGIK
jgi:hypothetical protein